MLNNKWLLSISFICLFLLSSSYQAGAAGGLSQLRGWNYQTVYWNGSSWSASGVDIDGQIGYPLTVGNPSAYCTDANNQGASWGGSPTITSGSLPPGLVMGPPPYQITGIPTARGHWIVEITFGGLYCNGGSFPNFTQELRFHIKGSGEVNE